MGNLISTKQFADRLGISVRTLEELILQGKVPPYIRLGRLRRWHPEQVDKWINEQFAQAAGDGTDQHRSELRPAA